MENDMSGLEDATRRAFLRASTLSCLVAASASGLLTLRPARAQPGVGNSQFAADLEVQLHATENHVPILRGEPTRVWRYDGKVLRGNPGSLGFLSHGYLPVLRVKRGQKVRIDLVNELPEPTVIHWHGLYVPADMDGHPRNAIATGQHYVYEFEVLNRAGTYWFHAHPDGHTGAQIYLVNGKPDFVLPVATRAYRLRILNGSNARIYKLGWSDRSPLAVIGTDGGLLEKPAMRPYITLSPAERVDVWVDFGSRSVGTELTLQSLAFDGAMAMGGMMGDVPLPNGASFDILKVRVEQRDNTKTALPARLVPLPALRPQDAVNVRNPKVFNITMGMMVWGVNGRRFEMNGVTRPETVRLNSTEIWEFRNEQSMMLMAHSMHVHGLQFRVLARTIQPDFRSGYRTLAAGLVDDGWKDTVLLMPGERVRLLLRFEHYAGMFLYHCHMLEHEDSGYLVAA
jgi:FtsP/CotA-like multicopper oxidase with cupredoxin domain